MEDTATADRNGRQLGYAALAALAAIPPIVGSYEYEGHVLSGATLGVWKHRPPSDSERLAAAKWRCVDRIVELPYRNDLPTAEATRGELHRWRQAEQAALANGDRRVARDARAMVERMTRLLTRLSALPAGKTFPYRMTLWRMGDAAFVAVEGEPYQLLQTALRRRFPGVPVFVIALAGGWRPAYLPTRDAYGQGIYQDSVAVLAPGCLETVTEAAAAGLESLEVGPPRSTARTS